MKKLFLTALVAVASLTASAQIWVGGEVGLNSSKTTNDGTEIGKTKSAYFAPEIGYKFSDNIDFAVAFDFSHYNGIHEGKGFDEDGEYGTITWDGVSNSFSFNPYIRYTFLKSGQFSAFVDGGFYYGFTHYSGDDENRINWGIVVRPGIAYSLTDKVGLVAHVGRAAWDFSKKDEQKTNAFGVELWNQITFGAYVNF